MWGGRARRQRRRARAEGRAPRRRGASRAGREDVARRHSCYGRRGLAPQSAQLGRSESSPSARAERRYKAKRGTMTIKRGSAVLAALAIALPAAAVGPAAAGSRTLVVDDDMQQCPNAGYTSINAAITSAAPGDKIRVCPGLYHENIVVDKAGLSLQGSTNGSTTEPCLRGDDAANPSQDSVVNGAVTLKANGVSLDSFTVQEAP